jgi:cyclomaltodextrinase
MSVDTPAWVRDAVFYQIFPDRFAASPRVAKPGALEPWSAPPTRYGFKGGDLLGIAEHLDDIAELGVTALYLTPVFQSASNHRYHAYDYLRVDPLLGGDDALRELLDACHRRGMRVVLDGVFNHCGRGFWPFHHVLENGADSPYLGWFHVDATRLGAGEGIVAYPTRSHVEAMIGAAQGDRSGRFSLQHLGYRAWWDHPALPKLNVGDPAAREYLLGVAEHWIRFGIDGWRLDVPQEIEDRGFWREFRSRVRAIRPDAYLVGEVWREAPEWLEGDRFDALMNYPLLEAILGFTAGPRLDREVIGAQPELAANVQPLDAAGFAGHLEHLLAAYDPAVVAVQLNLLGSHDTPRFVTMAGGDRAALRLATLLQMTLPGAPCIYYGDEVGMEGRHDPDCRGAFPAERDAWDRPLREFVRGAVALRHAHAALRAEGTYRTLASHGLTHVHLRADEREVLVVAVNAGDAADRIEIALPEADGLTLTVQSWAGWPADDSTGVLVEHGRAGIRVPPRDGLVLHGLRQVPPPSA